MEEQERIVRAVGRLTPRLETERQAYRAARRAFPVVLLCVGCSMLVFSQFLRIALSIAKILIFDRPL